MCGIVGVVGKEKIGKKAIAALESLEYRGYDSAGIGWSGKLNEVKIKKTLDGVSSLATAAAGVESGVIIGHSRWATHGKVDIKNAHPHNVKQEIAIVHNGIIENHKIIRDKLLDIGFTMAGNSDSECIVHLIKSKYAGCWYTAFASAITELEGAYAIAMVAEDDDCIYIAKKGSPMIIGVGKGENYISSSIDGLNKLTDEFIIIDDNELGKISRDTIEIINMDGDIVTKRKHIIETEPVETGVGEYGTYMMKEIEEQPDVIRNTILAGKGEVDEVFGIGARGILEKVNRVKIIACGTSFNSGLLGKYWVEEFCKIRCDVEMASEFNYREGVIDSDELIIFISQSGETADVINSIKKIKKSGVYLATLAICNSKHSELVRLSDFSFITRAGLEIGVASTKSFTSQLISLITLVDHIRNIKNGQQTESLIETERLILSVKHILEKKDQIRAISEKISKEGNCLFIGRDIMYPIALEGALKMKEISYIHAEGYAGGELKHGPIALVDEKMPVVALSMASSDMKIMSNIEEIKSRGGQVFVFDECGHNKIISPILMAVYMQILSYQVATILGKNVDRPRNLAKAVTVE